MTAIFDKEAFNDSRAYAFAGKKTNASTVFNSSRIAPQVKGIEYIPGQQKFLLSDTYAKLNMWGGFGAKPLEGECPKILEHIAYILPDDDARKYLLDCFASLLQNPDKKIRSVFLITGGQGVGKSTIRIILERMLGLANVGVINSGAWNEAFNAQMTNLHVAVVEELMTADRMQSYNTFKPLITDDFFHVNQKHSPMYYGRTPYWWMAFSNHKKPILLEDDDRRFYVINTPAIKRKSQYYKDLYDAMDGEIPAFMHDLMQRDILDFKPDEEPPMTPDKTELIKQSYTPTRAILEELIDAGNKPFDKDILSLFDIRNHLEFRYGLKPRALGDRNLGNTLKEIKGLPLGRIRVGKAMHSLWAIRNAAEKWKDATPASIKKEYTKRGTGI